MTILYNTDIPVIMICSRKPRLTQPYKSVTKVYYTAILRDSLVKTGVIPTTRAWLISLVILKGFSRTTTVMAPILRLCSENGKSVVDLRQKSKSYLQISAADFHFAYSFRCRFGHRLAPLNGATPCPGYPTGFTDQEITRYIYFFLQICFVGTTTTMQISY